MHTVKLKVLISEQKIAPHNHFLPSYSTTLSSAAPPPYLRQGDRLAHPSWRDLGGDLCARNRGVLHLGAISKLRRDRQRRRPDYG
jgi:hypothetical protein